MKRPDESFTDVLLRVTGGENDVMKEFGSWKETGLREALAEARDAFEIEGEDAIARCVERSQEPYFAPTIVLHELFVGAARRVGPDGIARLRADLDWVEPIPLSLDGAAETAEIGGRITR